MPVTHNDRTSPPRALSRRTARGDRPHRRGDARPADGARRDHRPPDRDQEDARKPAPPSGPAREADDDASAGRSAIAGILPLDTVEGIWRVIIATFTYVQAPFSVHADLSAGDALMRDSARFHFGFTVPFVPHMGAAGVIAAGRRIARRSRPGAGVATRRRGAWWRTLLESDSAPKIIARLPFVERRRSSGRTAGLRGLARRRAGRHGARGRDLERAGRRLGRQRGPRGVASVGRGHRPCRTAASTAPPLLVSAAATAALDQRHRRAGRGRRPAVTLRGPRRQPRRAAIAVAGRQQASPRSANGTPVMPSDPSPARAPASSTSTPMCRARARRPASRKIYKLSSNETPLGPSPKAIAAYHEPRRPSRGLPGRLRDAAARGDRPRRFGLDPDRIVCGAGSDELLDLLARAYVGRATRRSTRTHGFLVYPIATLGRGRHAGGRAGEGLHRRCRRDPRAR